MWIYSAIVALYAANYYLLSNKTYYFLDLLLVMLFMINVPYNITVRMLYLFITVLLFATLRVIFREDFRRLFQGAPLPSARKAVLAAILVLLLLSWSTVLSIRPFLSYHVTALKSRMKDVGMALERYSLDHEGKFPSRLGELLPRYMKEYPSPAGSPLSENEKRFYESRYGFKLEFAYETSRDLSTYTLYCNLPSRVRGNRGPMMYTPKEGIYE
ncbi:MAG: hypothetical protein RDV48_21755 [Candidatus Eremiobacteraeota bacterium]|nr:hypothetical protein [Candidatus Eremiobacteraeota bacterium]